MQAQSRTQRDGWAVKRGERKYEARWLDAHGKIRGKKGFTTKAAARSYSREQIEAVEKERQGELLGDRPETVGQMIDLFLEKHECDLSTRRTLRSQLEHARTEFGLRAPDSVRRLEVEDWSSPYHYQATGGCLIVNHHIDVKPDTGIPYPEVVHTLQWALGATSDIYIVFAKDPQNAARLMQRFKQLAHSFGATPAEIRREIVLQGNVVFYANTFTGLTPRRASLIKSCLR